jgi:hypothetical protein
MTVIIYWNFWTHKLEYIILMYLLRKYNSFNKSFHKYENYNIHNQRSCYQEDQTNVVFVDHNKQMLKIYPLIREYSLIGWLLFDVNRSVF